MTSLIAGRSFLEDHQDALASLPLDVLAYICSFIRLMPRLRVVSLVNKRWRAAVVRSVTEMKLLTQLSPEKEDRNYSELSRYYPYLTSLVVWANHLGDLVLPSSLACLKVTWVVGEPVSASKTNLFLAPYPALTSIEIEAGLPCCVPLLLSSAATLTHLSLEPLRGVIDEALAACLNVTRFPALRSLVLAAPLAQGKHGRPLNSAACVQHVINFYGAHASQLTHLDISAPYEYARRSILVRANKFSSEAIESISYTPLPSVTVLRLWCFRSLSLNQLERVLSNCPRLRALSTDTSATLHVVKPRSLLSSLTELRCDLFLESAAQEWRFYFQSVKRIDVTSTDDRQLRELTKGLIATGYQHLVRRYVGDDSKADEQLPPLLLQTCAGLEKLKVRHCKPQRFDDESICLRHLTDLELRLNGELTFGECVRLVRSALKRCPNLHALTFDLNGQDAMGYPLYENVATITDLITECKQRGIEDLNITAHGNLHDELVRILPRLRTEWFKITLAHVFFYI